MLVFLNSLEISSEEKQYKEDLFQAIRGEETLLDFDKIMPLMEANTKNRLEKWGVKTNAEHVARIGDTLLFLSTSRVPFPVIRTMSSKFPNVEIIHKWASDDIGKKTGRQLLKSGEILKSELPEDFSQEALKTYVSCWGHSPCVVFRDILSIKDCKNCSGCRG